MINKKSTLLFLMLSVLISGLLSGCSRTLPSTDASQPSVTMEAKAATTTQPSAKSEAATQPDHFKIDESMMANMEIAELKSAPLPSVLSATGKVQLNEDQTAHILSPLDGQVRNLKVKLGDSVQKGETLFFINSREVANSISEHLESHRDLDLSEKNLTIAKDQFAREKDLFEHQASSRVSLQQAENEVARAQAELAKNRARVARNEAALRVIGIDVENSELGEEMNSLIPVKSSINGTITERQVNEGQFVQSGNASLLTIADFSSVWVLADIFERDLHLIKVGQKAELTTTAYPNERFVAQVSRIGDSVDPATRTLKVRFLVANPNGRLKPEMFAAIKIVLDESQSALLLPTNAVITENGESFVFVASGEREFVRQKVEVIPEISGRLKVINGLKAGDRIVSNGTLLLRMQETRSPSDS